MKIYTNKNNTITFEIVIDLTIDQFIAASFNSSLSEDNLDVEIGEIIEEDYEAFIGLLYQRLGKMGFENLEPVRKSNNNNSNSRYFTLCRKSEYDTLTVNLVIYLRISDHRLPKHRGGNKTWDRYAATKRYHEQDLDNYRELNKENPDSISAWELSLIVNGNKFKTYDQAILYVENQIRPYL